MPLDDLSQLYTKGKRTGIRNQWNIVAFGQAEQPLEVATGRVRERVRIRRHRHQRVFHQLLAHMDHRISELQLLGCSQVCPRHLLERDEPDRPGLEKSVPDQLERGFREDVPLWVAGKLRPVILRAAFYPIFWCTAVWYGHGFCGQK
jgi:hypothetical protein